MPVVRNGGDKWRRNTSNATQDYQAGVQNPRRPWAQATAAAADAWNQGVQKAVAGGRFAKGVQKAGDAKYQAGATGKGVQRFAAGVAASGDAYDRGFAPYRQVIESTNLPARGARGDASNYQRVVVLGTALHDKKEQSAGG